MRARTDEPRRADDGLALRFIDDSTVEITAPAGSPGRVPLSPAGRAVIRINRRGC